MFLACALNELWHVLRTSLFVLMFGFGLSRCCSAAISCEGYARNAPSGGKTARSAESDIVGGLSKGGQEEFIEEKGGNIGIPNGSCPNLWKSTVFNMLYSRLLVHGTNLIYRIYNTIYIVLFINHDG